MNKIYFLFLFFLVFSELAFCQEYKFKLNRGAIPIPSAYTYQMDNYEINISDFVGIPDSVEMFRILSIDLQIEQGLYERFISGKFDEDDLKRISKIDTTILTKKSINHKLYILSGFLCNSKKHIVIVDSNMNKDFSDEKILYFGEYPKLNLETPLFANYEFANSKIYTKDLLISIKPFSREQIKIYDSEEERKNAQYYLNLKCLEHFNCTGTINNKKYNFFISSGAFQFGRFDKYDLVIQQFGKSNVDENFDYKNIYHQNQTIELENIQYKPSFDPEGNYLILKRIN